MKKCLIWSNKKFKHSRVEKYAVSSVYQDSKNKNLIKIILIVLDACAILS